MRRTGWAVLATVVAVALVLGQVSSVGPVVLPVTVTHGLHAGDALVVVVWLVVVIALAGRRRSTGPAAHRRS